MPTPETRIYNYDTTYSCNTIQPLYHSPPLRCLLLRLGFITMTTYSCNTIQPLYQRSTSEMPTPETRIYNYDTTYSCNTIQPLYHSPPLRCLLLRLGFITMTQPTPVTPSNLCITSTSEVPTPETRLNTMTTYSCNTIQPLYHSPPLRCLLLRLGFITMTQPTPVTPSNLCITVHL
ncbi:hypothetical protein J6590_020202 [Homalodisca vitripennis]|nr:hypothetical protein J6590_020202 [Homalodisca vitripennis]